MITGALGLAFLKLPVPLSASCALYKERGSTGVVSAYLYATPTKEVSSLVSEIRSILSLASGRIIPP